MQYALLRLTEKRPIQTKWRWYFNGICWLGTGGASIYIILFFIYLFIFIVTKGDTEYTTIKVSLQPEDSKSSWKWI